uniref:Uncharacterized protein n=2 Tax=Oryza sativa subsp. japonica TaxID=39947 RepID=Q2QZD9_ORYSJ|nr:hypothetical protein LOC_Os11g46820 [Oryza sativa Japonica Group]ABA95425.1 hypothetical protein LOC_Os11g46820 [Oryza sativa Japonica Group]
MAISGDSQSGIGGADEGNNSLGRWQHQRGQQQFPGNDGGGSNVDGIKRAGSTTARLKRADPLPTTAATIVGRTTTMTVAAAGATSAALMMAGCTATGLKQEDPLLTTAGMTVVAVGGATMAMAMAGGATMMAGSGFWIRGSETTVLNSGFLFFCDVLFSCADGLSART